MTQVFIHPSADVHKNTEIGEGTKIWNNAQVRAGAKIGSGCIISKDVYIDTGVSVGNNVKIQNGVSVYAGVTLEDGVFCGPHCVFTNDLRPRAVNPDMSPKSADDWKIIKTLVRKGASIGAHATIRCGTTIGEWAMIGAGTLVTHDVPPHAMVVGVPARLRAYVCSCGASFPGTTQVEAIGRAIKLKCPECDRESHIVTGAHKR